MTIDLLKKYWPPEDQILLLEAALTDADNAKRAWEKWCEKRSLDTASWEEVRLITAIAKRVREFDPTSPLLPRLEGIRKFIWSQTQICLKGTRPMLEALGKENCRLMLIKGSARLARDPKSAAERLLRDIDILVHLDDWEKVISLAKKQGWRCPNWLKLSPKVFPYHHAVPVSDGRGFEVDLHHLALFVCRNESDDDRIWERATPRVLQGLPYFTPSPSDELLLEIVHGFLYTGTPSRISDWVLDVAPLINSNQIDWSILSNEVQSRRLEVNAAAALLLLRERLKLPVPQEVIDRLSANIREPFLTDFERLAIQYDPLGKRQIECASGAASLRAIRSLRDRVPRKVDREDAPGRGHDSVKVESSRRYPVITSSPAFLIAIRNLGAMRLTGSMRLKVPSHLDPTDSLVLKFRVKAGPTSRTRRAGLLIRAPGLPLRLYDHFEPGTHDLIFEAPATLFILRRIRHVDFQLFGAAFLGPIRILRVGWIVRRSPELSGNAPTQTSADQRQKRLRRLEAAVEYSWSHQRH